MIGRGGFCRSVLEGTAYQQDALRRRCFSPIKEDKDAHDERRSRLLSPAATKGIILPDPNRRRLFKRLHTSKNSSLFERCWSVKIDRVEEVGRGAVDLGRWKTGRAQEKAGLAKVVCVPWWSVHVKCPNGSAHSVPSTFRQIPVSPKRRFVPYQVLPFAFTTTVPNFFSLHIPTSSRIARPENINKMVSFEVVDHRWSVNDAPTGDTPPTSACWPAMTGRTLEHCH